MNFKLTLVSHNDLGEAAIQTNSVTIAAGDLMGMEPTLENALNLIVYRLRESGMSIGG